MVAINHLLITNERLKKMDIADQRMAEVNAGLRELLEQLGLTPIMSSDLGTPTILFTTDNSNERSPVKLWISEPEKKGKEPSWGDCKIEVIDIIADKVGDNGWVYLWVASRNKVRLESDDAQVAIAKLRAGSGNLHSEDKWKFCLTSA